MCSFKDESFGHGKYWNNFSSLESPFDETDLIKVYTKFKGLNQDFSILDQVLFLRAYRED